MSGASYPVRTVIDMARIPPEAWPRFIAEMPAMLATIAPLVAIYDAMREAGTEIPDEAYMAMLAKLDWVDDDKGTADVTITGHNAEGDELFHSATRFTIPRDSAA